MKHVVEGINIENYKPHWLHSGNSIWPQSNCYVDLWIEVLHTAGLNPVPCFAFTLTADFEGDQWTFFKVPLHDLFLLYGIDVQELSIWQSLVEHVCEQTSKNRLVLMEVDAFYLPDVADTSYRIAHEKTTIGIHSIDPETRHLGYFHNSGYYTLQGTDFDGVFLIGEQTRQSLALPPYTEFAKLHQLQARTEGELVEIATALMREHFVRRPVVNPFIAYRDSLQHYLESLHQHDLSAFHKYAFATMRQYGACYEYASVFMKWLANYQGEHLREAASDFEMISSSAQTLMLKTARAVRSKKAFEYRPTIAIMEAHWEAAMGYVSALTCKVSTG